MKLRYEIKIAILFIISIAVFFAGCLHRNQTSNKEDNGLPPEELIRSNFSAAEFVLSVEPDTFKIAQTIYADNGAPGYVIVEVAGKVKECYKGEMVVGEPVRYKFMAEYEENVLTPWRKMKRLLVFLKKDEKNGELQAVEFGQFEFSYQLKKLIESIKK